MTNTKTSLTARELDLLAFEREWWKYAGAKCQAIETRFGCSTSVYYRELRILMDDPLAFDFDPMLIKRLRRMRRKQA